MIKFSRYSRLWEHSDLTVDRIREIEFYMPEGIVMVNPMHMCFDSTMYTLLLNAEYDVEIHVVHGIGKSSAEIKGGESMAHAWLEVADKALDTTWGVLQERSIYLENAEVEYSVKYTMEQALRLWDKTDHPGPWDKKIREVAKVYDNEVVEKV